MVVVVDVERGPHVLPEQYPNTTQTRPRRLPRWLTVGLRVHGEHPDWTSVHRSTTS